MTQEGVIRLAVFGRPVRHSLSPRIHRAFADQAGIEARYDAIDTGPGELAGALEAFAAEGGTGCNVTLPLKGEAMNLAARCSERVARAGAANTLTLEGGGWAAENTDGIGLVADLRRLGLDPEGRRLALLGAGGAAAGVLGELLRAGPRAVCIFNRTADRARELARRHANLGPVTGQGFDAPEGEGFDLVLNATSLGHDGGRPPLDASLFTTNGSLYDLNYGAAAAPLEAWARIAGMPFHDGLGMLVGQAAESFRCWTGFSAAVQPVLNELAS